jgi:hypothetical protein
MQLRYGPLAELEAAPAEGDTLAAFLAESRQAAQEDSTVTWYAFKAAGAVYRKPGTFATEEARSAHLSDEIPVALGAVTSRLLAAEPKIRAIDIIAAR